MIADAARTMPHTLRSLELTDEITAELTVLVGFDRDLAAEATRISNRIRGLLTPEHPDYPRILAVFNHATGPLRAKDVCEALGHEPLPKKVEGTRAKLKRLVKLGILTEADTGNFTRKQ